MAAKGGHRCERLPWEWVNCSLHREVYRAFQGGGILKEIYEEERKPFWSAFVGNVLGVIDIGGVGG